jgi:hypothetical protein
MTFKIDEDAMGRLQISIGVGRKFRATTLKEVNLAVEHYFNKLRTKMDTKHYNGKTKGCPLCEV